MIFKKLHETIVDLGGEKFYSSTDGEVKKVRESMAAMFFLLTLKKRTHLDWFLMQPMDVFPDFYIFSIKDGLDPVDVRGFELTEIPPRCETFEEAKNIVDKKLKKGYPKKYNLLIFVNNKASTTWLPLLHRHVTGQNAFREIWTLHMLSNGNEMEFGDLWANRISPDPVQSNTANPAEMALWVPKKPPTFAKVKKDGEHTFLTLDPVFLKAFRKYAKSIGKVDK